MLSGEGIMFIIIYIFCVIVSKEFFVYASIEYE